MCLGFYPHLFNLAHVSNNLQHTAKAQTQVKHNLIRVTIFLPKNFTITNYYLHCTYLGRNFLPNCHDSMKYVLIYLFTQQIT